jgi:hypothetical protein
MRLRLGALVGIALAVLVAVTVWVANARDVDGWLAVHAGLNDLTGPYYGFWSGIGSDLAELTLVGAVATGAYQLVRKYNCHQPRCWRVGNHPAAGGRFYLCWRHQPDNSGGKPTTEIIAQLHREHVAREQGLLATVHQLHGHAFAGTRTQPTPAADDHANDERRPPG